MAGELMALGIGAAIFLVFAGAVFALGKLDARRRQYWNDLATGKKKPQPERLRVPSVRMPDRRLLPVGHALRSDQPIRE